MHLKVYTVTWWRGYCEVEALQFHDVSKSKPDVGLGFFPCWYQRMPLGKQRQTTEHNYCLVNHRQAPKSDCTLGHATSQGVEKGYSFHQG